MKTNRNYEKVNFGIEKVEKEEMINVYARSTVLIRMTQHDGLAGMVEEALTMGRYVIWTYPLPGTFHAKDYKMLYFYVNKLLNLHLKKN